jgi:zinc/manganese transport system ATP-binding protein
MTRPVVQMRGASLSLGGRQLWGGLDLEVAPGEFLAVLGPNGAGKSSLLKVLLGLQQPSSGEVLVGGVAPRRGSNLVGYVPQQRGFDADLGARGRDLVALGADGHRYGRPWPRRAQAERVRAAIEAVGATGYADAPVGRLSGGEQQRLRIAQALVSDPELLLADEPLLSLDIHHQHGVVGLIDARRRLSETAIVMVTHEINPVLPIVDRVLYLVNGRWAIGVPDEVMTTACLSDLYAAQVDVVRIRGRIMVIGASGTFTADDSFTGSHHGW